MVSTTLLEQAKKAASRPRARGWIHLYASVVAAVAGVVLCAFAATRPGIAPLVSCVVYAVGTCGLFGVSALYHRRTWGPLGYRIMKRSDHSMIFLFIAATYTPFSVLLLPKSSATLLLWVVWSAAALGVALKMFFPGTPRWVSVPLYIALGWAAVFVMADLLRFGGVAIVVLLAVGGVFYTVGAVLYATKWPNPWTQFGHHEFFHAATVLAALSHYIGVFLALYA